MTRYNYYVVLYLTACWLLVYDVAGMPIPCLSADQSVVRTHHGLIGRRQDCRPVCRPVCLSAGRSIGRSVGRSNNWNFKFSFCFLLHQGQMHKEHVVHMGTWGVLSKHSSSNTYLACSQDTFWFNTPLQDWKLLGGMSYQIRNQMRLFTEEWAAGSISNKIWTSQFHLLRKFFQHSFDSEKIFTLNSLAGSIFAAF